MVGGFELRMAVSIGKIMIILVVPDLQTNSLCSGRHIFWGFGLQHLVLSGGLFQGIVDTTEAAIPEQFFLKSIELGGTSLWRNSLWRHQNLQPPFAPPVLTRHHGVISS